MKKKKKKKMGISYGADDGRCLHATSAGKPKKKKKKREKNDSINRAVESAGSEVAAGHR
jgi:hypothetical protein